MRIFLLAASALFAAPAAAQVKSASPTSFEVESVADLAATPAEAFEMLGRIGEWWNPAHSYSGDAGNLSLELRAGGCFCELLPASGGSVEHMRVVYAEPGKMLRLSGGLGPLQAQAVSGTLSWSLEAVEGGTRITQTYLVSGHVRGGAEAFAAPVAAVLAEQLTRLKDRLAR